MQHVIQRAQAAGACLGLEQVFAFFLYLRAAGPPQSALGATHIAHASKSLGTAKHVAASKRLHRIVELARQVRAACRGCMREETQDMQSAREVQGSRGESARRTMSAPGNSSSPLPPPPSPSLAPITAFMEPCAAKADCQAKDAVYADIWRRRDTAARLQGTYGGWRWLLCCPGRLWLLQMDTMCDL